MGGESYTGTMALPPALSLWLALWGLAFLTGAGLQMQQAELWLAWAYVACALGGLVLLGWARGGRDVWRLTVCALALAMLGFGTTGLRAHWRLAEALPAPLVAKEVVLTGVVASMPQAGPNGWRFVFEVEQALHGGQPVKVPTQVWLSWPRGLDGEALLAGPEQALQAGDRWRLPVRLRPPHGLMNPHGFDVELWMFEQNLRAAGTVRSREAAPAVLLAQAVGFPLERARQAVRDAILLKVPNDAAAGVVAALTVGDQSAIGPEQWALFRDTGIAHLMSISGLHVTMFAWGAAGLVGALWCRSGRAMRFCATPVAAAWGGVALAALYALFAGGGVPAQRTVWMLLAVAAMRTRGLRWPALLVLLAAAVLVVALDPWALLQPGFWLSFCAVGLLMVSQPAEHHSPVANHWARLKAAVVSGVRTQAVATLGLAPLSLVFFHQISLLGFFANLVAIPLVTLVITPLALLGVLWSGAWAAAAACVQALLTALSPLAAWSWAVWNVPAAPPWAWVLGLIGSVLVLLRLPWALRVSGGLLLVPLLWPPAPRPAFGAAEVVMVDIGQGTAVLVRTRHHLLMYDTGPGYSPQADAGGRVLLPLLRARGETQLDMLMISHRDNDHAGGAATLMKSLPVGSLRSSLEVGHPLLAAPVPHARCEAGQRWQWDGVSFEVMHPTAQDYAVLQRPNALSCVLRIAPQQGPSVLLTGDIEAAQEAALVERLGPALRTDVLLVPHHGSRTSSTAAFLEAVQPKVAVVQAGFLSRYGHPAPDVLARYAAKGITVVRSDACGAYTWVANAPARCEREVHRRYWHHRMP
jgi:competence protein ComEC